MEEVSSGLGGTRPTQRALQLQAVAQAHGDMLQFRKTLADRRCQGAKQQLRSSSRKREYQAMKSQPCSLTGFQILIWENAASPDVK